MKANADPQNNCITQRLSLYTTAAAGAVFASGVCAATTPSPNAPASFTVPDGTSDTLEFDIDGDGTVDLQFYASAASAGDPCEYPATNPGYAYVQGLDGNEIAREDYGGYASLVSGSFPAGGESTSSFAPFLSCQYSGGEDEATFEVGPGGCQQQRLRRRAVRQWRRNPQRGAADAVRGGLPDHEHRLRLLQHHARRTGQHRRVRDPQRWRFTDGGARR
jgi:hypothetical protein